MNRLDSKQSATTYILKSLIPYTDANMKLAYKPNLFFNDLEKLDSKAKNKPLYSRTTLRTTYYRAKQRGYFVVNELGKPQLTEKGTARLQPFQPKKMDKARLLVIFDIPEKYRKSRNRFRSLLVACKFKQVQRSVWISDYDSRELLYTMIDQLHLHGEVHIFESHDITPRALLKK
jgi:CRISPR-associated endonuclease Cas2